MNPMLMQLSFGLAECRERAKVVSISNPEYSSGSSSGIDILPLLIVILILVIAVVALVVAFVVKSRARNAAGHEMASSGEAVAPLSPQPSTGMVRCASCGASISSLSKFCPMCGESRE